jgi:thiol-disulfide isomerase/thioredoxin
MKADKGIIISGIILVLLGLFFFTPVGDWVTSQLNEKTLAGPNKEKPVREFSLNDENMAISLKGYNGTPDANLKDFKGKVTVLNFWGSWCPPCVEEMPSIQKLYEARGKEINIVLITMKDKPEKFLPFLQSNHYTMPVYEANSLLPKVLIPGSFPTTYILNKEGNIIMKEIKSRDWNSPEIHKILDELVHK